MSDVLLTTYQGVDIFVTEEGRFTCTHLGTEHRHATLTDAKRAIRGREIVPVPYMMAWDIDWCGYREHRGCIVALDGAGGTKRVHVEGDIMRDLAELYHFDQAAIDRARELDRQIEALREQKKALIKELRPITFDELVPMKGGAA